MTDIRRIDTIEVTGSTTLRARWRGGVSLMTIDLSERISDGGTSLALLCDPDLFQQACISDYGATIAWFDEDGDLAIDPRHIRRLAQIE